MDDYEPVRTLTVGAVARHRDDTTVSVVVLRSELQRIDASRIILNRGLRRAVLHAMRTQGLSLSEIAFRCGRVKRDGKGNCSGETSWLSPPGGNRARERRRRSAHAVDPQRGAGADRARGPWHLPPRGRALNVDRDCAEGPHLLLVAERDERIARPLVDQLVADGYRAQLARTTEHARVLARADPPDLALLGELEDPASRA